MECRPGSLGESGRGIRAATGVLLVAMGLSWETPCRAQTVEPLSIEDAIARAEGASGSVRAARAELERTRAGVQAAWGAWLPQVDANASYVRILESEFEPVFETPGGGGDELGFPNLDLVFGRDNTWRVGLSLTQEVFNGGRLTGAIDLAEAQRKGAGSGVRAARAQAVLDAVEAYWDAALTGRLVDIAGATLAQSEKTLADTQVSFEAGVVAEFDVLRASVSRDNNANALVEARAQDAAAQRRLRRAVGLPAGPRLELSSPLVADDGLVGEAEDEGVPEARRAAGVHSGAGRAPVDEARALVLARRAGVRIARSSHWPQLRLGSDFGLVNSPAEGLFPQGDWRPSWTVGVFLSVPLFSGFQISAGIDAAEAGVQQARAVLEDTTERAQLDKAQTRDDLEVAASRLRASGRTVQQAERAHEIAIARFETGVSTQLELLDARVLLERARVNEARAARDLRVARVRRALLPGLPIVGVSTSSVVTAQQSAGAPREPATEAVPAAQQAPGLAGQNPLQGLPGVP